MIERIPCSNPDCNHLILPETAAATGGQCRPCANAEQRKAYLAEIERNRKEINLYNPHDNALTWLKLSLTPRKHDPLILYTACPKTRQQLLAELNQDELEDLRDTAIANLIENPHFAENILRYLSSFSQVNLLPVLPYLLNNHDYSFEQLFRYADNSITQKLIERIEQVDEYQNLCLIALAWVNTPPSSPCLFTMANSTTYLGKTTECSSLPIYNLCSLATGYSR